MDRVSVSLRGLAAVAVVCAFTCLGATSTGAAPLALTTNYEAGSVSVINTQTNKVVGEPIEVGGRPKSIAITPDARFAYVAKETSGDVSVIDLATRQVVGKPIEAGFQPGQIAISPDGRTAYVANLPTAGILVIDTSTNQVTGEVPLAAHATGIAFAPDGKTAYVAEEEGATVQVVDTRTERVVGQPIQLQDSPLNVAISPDGKTLYVGDGLAGLAIIDTWTRKVRYVPIESSGGPVTVAPNGGTALVSQWLSDSVSVVNLQTDRVTEEIQVGEEPGEVALTPDGKFAYVRVRVSPTEEAIRVINLENPGSVAPLIPMPGGVSGIAITPDRSPTAAFSVTGITAAFTATFDGSASTDPDGTVNHWAWAFGDGSTASEVSSNLGTTALGSGAVHAYSGPGVYPATLTVLDDEGCGVEEVFTGRTAYCSGNPAATVTHPVEVKAPPTPVVCRARFALGGVSHNRKNGTVRLRLRFPTTGSFLLFGKKIHAVTRKVRKAGTTMVTLHARVELNKRLKKTHHAKVRYRVTFTPAAGCGSKTAHRSVALLRAPRKRHHH